MSKKPVAYIKPQDPAFLVKLKKEAGYKEGPTVETKREVRGLDSDEEFDPEPQVVVLKDGDLTAEEAARIRIEKEKAEANIKADLSKPIVFQKRSKLKAGEDSHKKRARPSEGSSKDAKKAKNLLSFDEEDE